MRDRDRPNIIVIKKMTLSPIIKPLLVLIRGSSFLSVPVETFLFFSLKTIDIIYSLQEKYKITLHCGCSRNEILYGIHRYVCVEKTSIVVGRRYKCP